MARTTAIPSPLDWPVYWFAKLDEAVEDGDHQAAAEAQRELARLGVQVKYGRSKPQREVDLATS